MIKQLPTTERPRERCLQSGADTLSLRECLAVLLGNGPKGKGCLGLAAEILGSSNKNLDADEEQEIFFNAMEMGDSSLISGISGIGDAGRSRLMVACELGRRYALYRERKRLGSFQQLKLSILERQALKAITAEWRNKPYEWLAFTPVLKSSGLGRFCVVEKGTRTHVNIDPQELFARLLIRRPQAFFLFHNHPSGDLVPSSYDYDLTVHIANLAEQLNLILLGHWIVSGRKHKLIEYNYKI